MFQRLIESQGFGVLLGALPPTMGLAVYRRRTSAETSSLNLGAGADMIEAIAQFASELRAELAEVRRLLHEEQTVRQSIEAELTRARQVIDQLQAVIEGRRPVRSTRSEPQPGGRRHDDPPQT